MYAERENCLVSEKVRYEEVKSLAPTLTSLNFPCLPYLPTVHQIFSLPIPNTSFSLTYLPCPVCSSLIPIFVFTSQPSSVPLNLPVFLPIFPFPSRPSLFQPSNSLLFPFPTYLLPSLPISFPTCPLSSLPFRLSHPSPPIPFFCCYPSPFTFLFPPFPSSFPSPFSPFSSPFSLFSPTPLGGGVEFYTALN